MFLITWVNQYVCVYVCLFIGCLSVYLCANYVLSIWDDSVHHLNSKFNYTWLPVKNICFSEKRSVWNIHTFVFKLDFNAEDINLADVWILWRQHLLDETDKQNYSFVTKVLFWKTSRVQLNLIIYFKFFCVFTCKALIKFSICYDMKPSHLWKIIYLYTWATRRQSSCFLTLSFCLLCPHCIPLQTTCSYWI